MVVKTLTNDFDYAEFICKDNKLNKLKQLALGV